MRPQNDNRRRDNRPREPKEFEEKVIQVNRVSKKTKGGNQMGFSVLVVVGNKKGKVGVGLGKAKDVMSSVQKAVKKAKRRLLDVPIQGSTIPFAMNIKFGAAHILLKPAPPGSGIIAGGAVRAVVDAAGIKDISSKIKGTSNKASNVYATLEALKQIRALVDTKGITLKSNIQAEEEERQRVREHLEKEQASKAAAAAAKPVAKKVAKPEAPKVAPKTEAKKVESKVAEPKAAPAKAEVTK